VADTEVQEILREIRERVRAEEEAAPSLHEELAQPARPAQSELQTRDILARLEMHSRTTLRAWDRLPPLTTRRTGLLARLELWFKRQMRRATHWYAWEQVNFNAAVKDALQDVAAALSNQEKEMMALRQQLSAVTQMKVQLASHLSSLESSLRQLEDKFAALPSNETQILLDEMQAIRTSVTDLRANCDDNLTRLRDEQRAQAEQLRDEHRVAFKQLSLKSK
jgi:chromosome segregation ATPase